MKFTITGSLGNISKPLTQILVNAGHEVTVISSNTDKTKDIEALGAKAAIGSIDDIDFLTRTFTGADAIYVMCPPSFTTDDYRAYISATGRNYAAAIQASGVKQIVNLSSIGAHLSDGTGPIKGLHDVEQIFNTLEGVAVKHMRPSYFYFNLYGSADMIRHAGILGSNYGESATLVMVHPTDIAIAIAEEIQQPFTGKSVRYVTSDVRPAGEVATVLGNAIGKPELKWVEFTDQQALEGMIQAGLSEEIAKNYVEMGSAIRSGVLWEDFELNKPVFSATKLEDFAKEFAAGF
ncbi:NAD-dependent dehydratase [Pedobacter lusitanus]|uniref:NAD-dependent dehydratase n=1 Tax=Pedobacter lusitanus TaxID=1503925 RepID=A0A0D0FRD3_9SPHI|nr:NAD(P)H-binding protein [Pedobacter lusitanus]KIO75014.1 NAD-dependent dehydratase [Pedobacter lusitanus]